MVRSISKRVIEEWVARILYGLRRKVDRVAEALERERAMPQIDEEAVEDWESIIMDLRILEGRLVREYPRVVPEPLPPDRTEDFKVRYDFTGWKYRKRFYELLERMPVRDRDIFLALDFKDVTVAVTFERPTGALATWSGIGLLQIWCNPDVVDSYEVFAKLRMQHIESIRHEIQHLGQSLLSDVINRAGREDWHRAEDLAGLPPKRMREKGRTPGGVRPTKEPRTLQELEDRLVQPFHGDRIEHPLRDAEFYTVLQDEIDKTRRLWKTVPWRYRTWAVDRIVGGPEMRYDREGLKRKYDFTEEDVRNLRQLYVEPSTFFRALKRSNPSKWRKAVVEFVKVVLS